MPSRNCSMKKNGFTLIELLVVIAIIGILASIIMVSLSSARAKARDATREQDIEEIQNALEIYYTDHGQYPLSGGANSPNGGWSNSNDSSWAALQTALAPYISPLPTDPTQTSGWPGNAGNYSFAYYSQAYGCPQGWYMLVWRPEVSTTTSPGVTACDGTTFNYGGGAVTIGSSGK